MNPSFQESSCTTNPQYMMNGSSDLQKDGIYIDDTNKLSTSVFYDGTKNLFETKRFQYK